MQFTVLAAS